MSREHTEEAECAELCSELFPTEQFANGGPRVMGNKWRSRRAVRSAQLPRRLDVATFGFVVHGVNFQPGDALCRNYRVRVWGSGFSNGQ